MTTFIAAHTGPTPDAGYVGYINATEYESGLVRILVRTQTEEAGVEGEIAFVDLTAEQWARFLARSVQRGSDELLREIGKALNEPEIRDAHAQD